MQAAAAPLVLVRGQRKTSSLHSTLLQTAARELYVCVYIYTTVGENRLTFRKQSPTPKFKLSPEKEREGRRGWAEVESGERWRGWGKEVREDLGKESAARSNPKRLNDLIGRCMNVSRDRINDHILVLHS
uniref:Uncharacterized protein n=1 Tax=Oryza punctata TaxID=4537 RepID=A0A0E0M1B0_ORYPU